MTVLFAVTDGGEARVARVTEWIEEELKRIKKLRSGSLFRVAMCDLSGDPQTIYLSPIWREPFKDVFAPIISKEAPKTEAKDVTISNEIRAAFQELTGEQIGQLSTEFLAFAKTNHTQLDILEYFAIHIFPNTKKV